MKNAPARLLAQAVVVVLMGAWLFAGGVEAAGPQLKTQAPGYYRLMLGDFEITALSDGTFDDRFGPSLGRLLENLSASGYRADQVGLYDSAGRLEPFSGSADLFPGIRALPAPGHTPGHTLYAIESKGQKLVLWGDLMEIEAIQFVEPMATIAFASDGPEAAAQRPQAYADAARGRHLIGASQLPFPGIGHLRAEGPGFVWVPIAYDRVR